MAEDKPFRVLLDLSELNLNSCKYMWMNVSPRELNNIADFKNAVLKKLNFDRNVKLFVHDGLLPEDEKIIVLRENDTVKILYDDILSNGVSCNSSSCGFNSSRVSNLEKSSSDYDTKELPKKRKRKSEIDVSDAAEGNNESSHKSHSKKKKHKRSHSTSTSEEKNSEEKTSEENNSEEITPEITINISEIETISVESQDSRRNNENTYNVCKSEPKLEAPLGALEVHPVSPGSNCKKRKRKRHKKRKNEPDAVESLSVPYAFSSASTQVKDNTSPSFSDNFSSIRKHIRFTSPTPSFGTTNENKVDLSPCERISNSESALEVTEAYKTPDTPLNKPILYRNSTPSLQTYVKQNSWNVSPLEQENCTEIKEPSTVKNNKSQEIEKNIKCPYRDCHPLKVLPSIGTHIVFKTLELDENYSPSVTPYKEGIVRNIDPETEDMEIELIEKEVKPGRVGKFENLAEDEVPNVQVVTNVTVKWSSLIEPRWFIN